MIASFEEFCSISSPLMLTDAAYCLMSNCGPLIGLFGVMLIAS